MTQSQWQRLAQWPLTIVAAIFLAAYSWLVIGDLRGQPAVIADTIIAVTWAIFVIDYILNLALASHRWFWFRRHIFDLLVVALPALRPLRLLRLVTFLRVLQRTAGNSIRGRVLIYTIGASVLLIYVAALAVLEVERPASGADIATFGDALWWSFVTITTVGYGDLAPITGTGRLVAAGLMLGGIALLGIVTATLASWIVERVSEREEEMQTASRADINALSTQLAELRESLNARDAAVK